MAYTLTCEEYTWFDYLFPSELWVHMFLKVEKGMNFLVATIELAVGVLNVWIPEASSLVQIYEHPDKHD